MAFVYKCDSCGDTYEHGFTGNLKKIITWKGKDYNTEFEIRPPHLCKKCFPKFLALSAKELRALFNM